jgi:hypothetical protein
VYSYRTIRIKPFSKHTLNAETGDLKAVALVCSTPPPSPANPRVSYDDAARIAADQAIQAGFIGAVPLRLDARIVRPNAQWLGGTEGPLPGLPRFAWVCQFFTGDSYPVFIDMETGKLIGGDAGRPRGRLVTASTAKPLCTMSDRTDGTLFAGLRKAAGTPADPPKVFGSYRLVVVDDKGQSRDLTYDGATGLLGSAGGWFKAPGPFRDWLAKKEAAGD